ncbi:MAG: hypothetical protein IJX14_06625, partial [Clostridia bacterium]|nr:hypothetical protein [Clostridia bacterium]
EDVRDFGDVLAFLGDTVETEITGVSLDISSETQVSDPMELSEADTAKLVGMLEEMRFTAEKNMLYRYGGSDYVVLFHLSGGETVYITAEADFLTIWKDIKNTEGKGESAEYHLLPDAPADTQAVLDAVVQIWEESTHHAQTGITPER